MQELVLAGVVHNGPPDLGEEIALGALPGRLLGVDGGIVGWHALAAPLPADIREAGDRLTELVMPVEMRPESRLDAGFLQELQRPLPARGVGIRVFLPEGTVPLHSLRIVAIVALQEKLEGLLHANYAYEKGGESVKVRHSRVAGDEFPPSSLAFGDCGLGAL